MWMSTSETAFWGKRWHQLFRHLFVVCGSRPGRKIAGWYSDHGDLHRFGHHGPRLYLGAEVAAVDGQGGVGRALLERSGRRRGG